MPTWFQKYIRLVGFIILSGVVLACDSGQPVHLPKVTYIASLKGDTAIATIEESKSLFKGVLEIRYKSGYKDSGNVKGFIKGDTLMGEYHFQRYWLPVWKRNPIIFLRKGDKLIMGKGVVTHTMGIPHYNNKFPVDYTESNSFVFRSAIK
ncbi:MAG: hypothetical protein WKF66_15245 [Pedobacter sp.]